MRSTVTINIAAPAELVFRLVRDVSRWPDLLPHYGSVRIMEPPCPDGSVIARMVARRPLIIGVLGIGLPVTWQARVWIEPETLRLRFVHVAGPTKGMEVMWRIESTATGCRVSIEHDFRPRLPIFAAFVDRWFIQPIAGRTLATFKALAETLTDAPPGAMKSERARRTNLST